VLFFPLAGVVAKDRPQPLGAFLRSRLASRVVPLLFFNLLLAARRCAGRCCRRSWRLLVRGSKTPESLT